MPDLLALFAAQGRVFEEALLDDDWTRLESYFTADAVYETLGPGGERFVGRPQVLAALRRAVNAFDRRCGSRELVTTGGPDRAGDEVTRQWACAFTLAGAPDVRIEGTERAVYRGDQIELLQERLRPESRESLASWVAAYGALVSGRS